MASTQTKILKYALLPEVLPRLYRLVTSGFGYAPVFMAMIYQTVGLLPAGHAYLNPANAGRFGIRHVIAEAANNLVLDRKHLDQIIVFFILIAGVVLLVMQFGLLVVSMIINQPVFALPPIDPLNDLIWVTSPYNAGPTQDLAFIMLDRIFGTVGIFDSCIAQGVTCVDLRNNNVGGYTGAYPSSFHLALHTLFRFYSLGIFVVSVILITYFVITVTAETAATGIPFGQRLNRAWAPVRLIIFAALLVPLNIGGNNEGLNAGQLIVLWSAKLGSNFASNAWGRFNQALTTTYLGQQQDLIGTPNMPNINALAQFMFTVKACQIAENYAYGHEPNGIQAYIVRPTSYFNIVGGPDSIDLRTSNFTTARDFSNWGNIHIRFGEFNDDGLFHEEFQRYNGFVKPFCGDVQVKVTHVDTGPVSGAGLIQEVYYDLIKEMWDDPDMVDYARCIRDQIMHDGHNPGCNLWPDIAFQQMIVTRYQNYIQSNLTAAINQEIANGDWNVSAELTAKGWGGAAIWYNRIAQMNGDVLNAVYNLPQPESAPYIMQVVASTRTRNNESLSTNGVFDPEAAEGRDIHYPRETGKDRSIAAIENVAWSSWDKTQNFKDHFTTSGEGAVVDTINALLGTSGIFEMRRNTTIHPLAQLSALGKGMMEASITNFTAGTGLTLAGKIGGPTLDPAAGKLMVIAGSFMTTIASTTMAISFILYYVLPFMPFLYFFFAAGGWLKAIFEAMVAMPLWALAHLRIDGQGMSGPAASSGYFLILEIFLRPILIVFGLLASIQIFAAMVVTMNDVFDLVVANASGFDQEAELLGIGPPQEEFKRGAIDRFFFTCIYVVMCYMAGLGCFKMIDYVPNTILRWIGVSASTLNDDANQSAGAVMEKTYEAATIATGKLQGGQLAALLVK